MTIVKGIVAIVGRPNVGKSTLFNRLTRTKHAIVDDQPGVTRDRLYGTVKTEDERAFVVVDTGGFETKDVYYQPFAKNIVWEQTEIAIEQADVVLLMFDAQSGIHQHDTELVRYLKAKGKKTVYAVNKTDGLEQTPANWEFYRTGVENILSCSAAHNRGIKELVAALQEALAEVTPSRQRATEAGATKIAIIGKPNAGKSSILNRLTGEERALVSDVAGTTRDSIDTPLTYNSKTYTLIDTAGIRRKTRITDRLESMSVVRSLRVIDEADVIVLVLSGIEGLTDQDIKLIELIDAQYKPLLIVVNKWDLVPDKETKTAKIYEDNLRRRLGGNERIPILFASCLQNQRVHKIMPFIERLSEDYNKRVSTAKLNEALRTAVSQHTPALIRGHKKSVKFYFATQVRCAPPTLVVMCNVADEIHDSYKRYLEKRLREALDFGTAPMRLMFRGKKEQQLKKDAAQDPETAAAMAAYATSRRKPVVENPTQA